MKKKILSLILALASSFAYVTSVTAEKSFISNEREIVFCDPDSEIENGVLLVPARQFCKTIGASISWNDANKRVIIDSSNNATRLFLYVGNPELRIFTFTGVADGDGINVPIEAKMKIVNERALIPFEQVCKALKIDYSISDDKTQVSLKSCQKEVDEKRVELSIYSDKQVVKSGEDVTIYIKANNLDLYPDYLCSGLTAGIIYDQDAFCANDAYFTTPTGEKKTDAIGAFNANFSDDSMKMAFVTIHPDENTEPSSIVGKVTFTALKDGGATFKLSNRVTDIGDDSTLVFMNPTNNELLSVVNSDKLIIKTDDLVIK